MKNTQFNVEDIFVDVISEDNFSQEQTTELNNLIFDFKIKIGQFKPRRNEKIVYQSSASLEYNFQKLNDKDMLCGWKTL